MKKYLFPVLAAFIFPMLCIAQHQSGQVDYALTPVEIDILDIIKNTKKPIWIRTPGAIPHVIAIELEDRQKPENRHDWSSKRLIKILTADVAPVEQLWRNLFTRVQVYANQRNAEKSELVVIDEKIVVLGFNSPGGLEVIRDQKLARSYIAELKADKSWRDLWIPKEVKRKRNSMIVADSVVGIAIASK